MFTTALQNHEFTNAVANTTLSTLTIMTDNKLNCICLSPKYYSIQKNTKKDFARLLYYNICSIKPVFHLVAVQWVSTIYDEIKGIEINFVKFNVT